MAANDAAGEAEAANPVLTARAAENGAHGETEAINPAPNWQTANRERQAEASDAVGEAEATAVLTARAAENGAHGETEAINPAPNWQAANRGLLTAPGEPGRAEAPTERAIASRHRPRRSRKLGEASSGCSAPIKNHNRAWSSSASPTARRRK